MSNHLPLLDLWLAALKEPQGLCIETDDRALLRQQLYRARTAAKMESLEQLVIIFPLKDTELWLVKRDGGADAQ